MEDRKPVVRELFVEELAEVTGGAGPVEEILDKIALSNVIQEHFYTTMACGEEAGSGC